MRSFYFRLYTLLSINPTYPLTKNKVKVENYWILGNVFEYIGFSISINRASVRLKGRTGKFYSLWKGEQCSSLLEYEVKRVGDNLEVTGPVYKCFTNA